MIAEAVADEHLFQREPLAQQVEGEDLSVVIVVDDLRRSGRLPAEGPHPRLPVGHGTLGEEDQEGGEGVGTKVMMVLMLWP